ncbi:MAG: glycosyltransferase [bacterium]
MFIIGGGSEIEKFEKLANENIIFTQNISPEKIHLFFKVIDLGVLPFIKIPFTDYAFPLKVLEYGASQKKVIATPLQELVYLNFPHLVLTERKIENWVNAIKKEKNSIWNQEWNEIIKKYNWNVIIQKLQKIIEG